MEKENSKIINILSLGHLSVDAYAAFLTPIMPFIALKIGFNIAIATIIISISHLCSSIIQPFFGFIADKFQKRFFIFWGMFLAALFLPLTGTAHNVFLLTLFLVLGNLGVSFYHPQATGFIKQYSTQNAIKNMSLFLTCGTIGYSVGPLISSFFAKNFGLEKLPYASILGLILAALLLRIVPKIEQKYKIKEVINKEIFTNFLEGVRECFAHPKMKLLFLIAVAKCLTVSSFSVFLPFLWQGLGYSVTKIGFLIFLFVASGALATITSPFFERKLGAINVFYLSLLSIMPLAILFNLTYKTHPLTSFAIFCAVGFTAMLAVPINMVMAQNTIPERKGLISGFIGGLSWGIIGLLLPITGIIGQTLGIQYMLILVSLVPLICAFFVKKLK